MSTEEKLLSVADEAEALQAEPASAFVDPSGCHLLKLSPEDSRYDAWRMATEPAHRRALRRLAALL